MKKRHGRTTSLSPKRKRPRRRERRRVRRETEAAARREGASGRPFERDVNGKPVKQPARYQELVESVLGEWLETFAAIVAMVFASLNEQVNHLRRQERSVSREYRAARGKENQVDPRLPLSPMWIVAVVTAAVIGMVAAWGYLESQDLPLPITALFALCVALLEIASAGIAGALGYGLVLDEPGVFDLTSKQRKWFIAWFGVALALTLVIVIGLAVARGNFVLWLVLGLIAAALGILVGAALYENQHRIAATHLERVLLRIQRRIDVVRDTYVAICRAIMAEGRTLRALAADILATGDVEFERTWRRQHREPDAVPPAIPQVALPDDEALEQRLIVALRDPGVLPLDGTDPGSDAAAPESGTGPAPLRPAPEAGSEAA